MTQKLELFFPVRPFRVFQKFGESLACTPNDSTPGNRLPIVGKIGGVCPPGFRELYPVLGFKGHTGQDLYAPDGAILRAPHDGIINELNTEVERGLGIGLVTKDKRDLGQYGVHFVKTRQWHLKVILVKIGQEVKCGEPIGLADSTGLSSASHDHFEVKPIDFNNPATDPASGHYNVFTSSYYNTFQNNGFFGSCDPAPYWNGIYSEDYKSLFQDIPAMLMKLALGIQNYLKKGRQK